MNKKGLLNFYSLVIIIFMIISLFSLENGEDKEIIKNSLNKNLNFSQMYPPIEISLDNIHQDLIDNEAFTSIILILKEYLRAIIVIMIELIKVTSNYALNHPDIFNARILIFLLIASLIAPLIYPTFIIIVSLVLIIREYIQTKKEKKRLKEKEEQNNNDKFLKK